MAGHIRRILRASPRNSGQSALLERRRECNSHTHHATPGPFGCPCSRDNNTGSLNAARDTGRIQELPLHKKYKENYWICDYQ